MLWVLIRSVPQQGTSNEYHNIYVCEEIRKNEPAHVKTYKMACAPSEDSNQPGHPPSLISLCRVFNG